MVACPDTICATLQEVAAVQRSCGLVQPLKQDFVQQGFTIPEQHATATICKCQQDTSLCVQSHTANLQAEASIASPKPESKQNTGLPQACVLGKVGHHPLDIKQQHPYVSRKLSCQTTTNHQDHSLCPSTQCTSCAVDTTPAQTIAGHA